MKYSFLSYCWQHRHTLHTTLKQPNYHINTVLELTATDLITQDIRLLALDFDGVLSAHGSDRPIPPVNAWLQALITDYPEQQICIYSNHVFPARTAYLQSHFPKITVIDYQHKKPNPHDLQRLLQQRNLRPAQALVIDDRITSGFLAAVSIGAQARLVDAPFTDITNGRWKEYWFRCVRLLEKKMYIG